MNAKEIKEKSKKLGYTQKKLAELVGVSTQTINGYENGKEIPSTKHQILDKVLNGETPNKIMKHLQIIKSHQATKKK